MSVCEIQEPVKRNEPTRSASKLRIGSLILDREALELIDGDRVEVLRPLPAALLFYLLRQRHRIVPKQELHSVLWPETSVSDSALASAVRDLRRILGDDGDAQRIVRTFRGRGYRLIAAVEIDSPEPNFPTFDPLSRPDSNAAGPVRKTVFVGRERELGRFERIRLAAGGGRGSTLLIESIAASGRSALLEECARRASGVLWLGVRCSGDSWVPRFDVITQLVVELEAAVSSDRLEGWIGADREVAHLVPDFLMTLPGPLPSIAVLAAAARRLLDRARRLAPVVIAIDDIHHIDRCSLELLCAGAARTTLLVGTLNPALASSSTRVGINALFSERSRMRLGGLTPADISDFARDLPQSRQDSKWAARVHERTAGHPADTLALIRELETPMHASNRTPQLLPRAVFDRISSEINALSRPARALLTACAALPPGANIDLAHRLADITLEPGSGANPVAECVLAGLMSLRARPVGAELRGQFVRHVLLASVSPARLRELERWATEVLRSTC